MRLRSRSDYRRCLRTSRQASPFETRTQVRQLGADEGFAATDALVALLILSATLSLAMAGVQTARHLSDVASQTSQAARLGEQLLARGGDGLSRSAGRSGRFTWTLEDSPRPERAELCTRELVLRSLTDHRIYRFTSAGECG